MKYRKKPVVIDAIIFDGDNMKECEEFIKGNYDNTLIGNYAFGAGEDDTYVNAKTGKSVFVRINNAEAPSLAQFNAAGLTLAGGLLAQADSSHDIGADLKRFKDAYLDTLTLTTPLDETQGGTGRSSFTPGAMFYASDASTLTEIAPNAGATQYLSQSGSGLPAWGAGTGGGDVLAGTQTANYLTRWDSVSDTIENSGVYEDVSNARVSVYAGTSPTSRFHVDSNIDSAFTVSRDGQNAKFDLALSSSGGVSTLADSSGDESCVFSTYGHSYLLGGNFGIGKDDPSKALTVGSSEEFSVTSGGAVVADSVSANLFHLYYLTSPPSAGAMNEGDLYLYSKQTGPTYTVQLWTKDHNNVARYIDFS